MKKYRKPLYLELWAAGPDEADAIGHQLAVLISKSGDFSAYVNDASDVVALEDDDGNDLTPTYFVRNGQDGNIVHELKATTPDDAAHEAVALLGYSIAVELPSDDEDDALCTCGAGYTNPFCPTHGEKDDDEHLADALPLDEGGEMYPA